MAVDTLVRRVVVPLTSGRKSKRAQTDSGNEIGQLKIPLDFNYNSFPSRSPDYGARLVRDNYPKICSVLLFAVV